MTFFQRGFSYTIRYFFIGLAVFMYGCNRRVSPEPVTQKRQGTALVITGAAAKIPQEAALLEHLYKNGELNDVEFISGASSGAINLVVLNAILDKRYTWEQYKKILFGIRDDSIFIRNNGKLPVDTEPLHNFLADIFNNTLKYYKLADLPYPGSISIVNTQIFNFFDRTYRLSNYKINSESDSTLDLVDVIMASCSYPFVFPPRRIRNVTTIPDVEYIDGGIAADHVPFEAVIEFENYRKVEFEKVLIISRKRDTIPDFNAELENLGLEKHKIIDKLGISMEDISKEGFIRRLRDIQKTDSSLAQRTFVYVPDFSEVFYMFNFNTFEQQYTLTEEWTKTHNPILLNEYLEMNDKESIKQ